MRGPAFSTLGCPEWTLEQALARGREYGYTGVELRLIDGEFIDDSMSASERSRVGRLLASSGLELVSVDSSITISEDEPRGVAKRIARFLELAAGWGAPLIRVFGGDTTRDHAVQSLNLAAREAETTQCGIGLETHDTFSAAASVAAVLDAVDSPRIGAIWDIAHTQRAGDSPAVVIDRLGDRILDVHIKDAVISGREVSRYVLLGEGDVPVQACLSELNRAGYGGWVVAEWEKRWHREIEEPEVALPQHAAVLGEWLRAL
jgi:fatty-acyl-CoA synthase